MFTLNSLLNALCEAGKLDCQGRHYEDESIVYTGDLWRLWPSADRLETKNQNRLASLMERKGMQLRFYDEIISDNQGRAHESQPGSYGDMMTWKILDCEVWAKDEAQADVEAYVQALLSSEGSNADTFDVDLESVGFQRFEYDAESGWHQGQTDTPEGVAEMVKAAHGEDIQIVFKIDDKGQFDIHFSAWWRKEED